MPALVVWSVLTAFTCSDRSSTFYNGLITMAVMRKYTLAKIHYIKGARSEAAAEFAWVAENGGVLACARESDKIAETIRNMLN